MWENRYVNDIGNDCLASVDGTDFQLAWGAKYKQFVCHKFNKKPGLRYEVAVCLRTSDIVWINGPHYPGTHNDIAIFQSALIHLLDDGERLEADRGYIGEHPTYIKMPTGIDQNENRQWLDQRHRNRHETVNKRFKVFNCMNSKFRHSMEKHGDCFNCVATLTQLSMDYGGVGLFPVVYDDTVDDFDEEAGYFW